MAFSYKPLIRVLFEREINREDLRIAIGASPTTMAKITKNEYISMGILDKICEYLGTQPGELMEYYPTETKKAVSP